jgi:hypothetical protein
VKITVDVPDELLTAAKKAAVERHCTIRELIANGLRHELSTRPVARRPKRRLSRWHTVKGGLPEGVDISNRERMLEWLERR